MEAQTVLVAEDDDEMRSLLVRALRRSGYEAVELEDGFELVDYLECVERSELAAPDALVTDVRMPGRSGLDGVAHLKRVRPQVPVVVITAFPDDALVDRAQALGVSTVLGKPFDLDAVCAAVERALRSVH